MGLRWESTSAHVWEWLWLVHIPVEHSKGLIIAFQMLEEIFYLLCHVSTDLQENRGQ